MNLTHIQPRNVQNNNNCPLNIRFVAKTSDIKNFPRTSDLMLKHQKWQLSETYLKGYATYCRYDIKFECCKGARKRFHCANALVILHSCPP